MNDNFLCEIYSNFLLIFVLLIRFFSLIPTHDKLSHDIYVFVDVEANIFSAPTDDDDDNGLYLLF